MLIRRAVLKTIRVCLVGLFFCTAGFLATGHFIGNVLFGNALAGTFIRTLGWICPFLYLGVTLSSILHGLGYPGITFVLNLIACGIRILFVLFALPSTASALSVRTSHQPGRHGSPLHRNSAAPDTSHFPLCIRKIICTKNTGKPDYGLPVFLFSLKVLNLISNYTLDRYSPVRVSILITSPCSTNRGTYTVAPVSTIAGLVAPVAVSPLKPGSVSVI